MTVSKKQKRNIQNIHPCNGCTVLNGTPVWLTMEQISMQNLYLIWSIIS